MASEICAVASERCFGKLKAAPIRVTSPFVNVPTPMDLVETRAPGVEDVLAAIRKTLEK